MVTEMTFTLHPQLAADTLPVADLAACRVLLMNNSNFPWLILVPMRGNLREIFDLGADDYRLVMDEVKNIAEKLAAFTKADKINVAALGNIVPQLHIHIIARYANDAAWPNPVWNSGITAKPYDPQKDKSLINELKEIF